MQKKMKITAGILTVFFCLLAGCQRKEQSGELLLLPVEGAASQEQEGIPEPEAESLLQAMDVQERLAQESAEQETGMGQALQAQPTEPPLIVVHICGAVQEPGVYSLEPGSRLYQGIELAGGFSDKAQQDYLNQAEFLADGMKIYVPSREEVEALQETAGAEAPEWVSIGNAGNNEPNGAGTASGNGDLNDDSRSKGKGLVNINTADQAELCTLPGIGSSKAESIIRYREAHGEFHKIEDIMNVEGIKEGLFNKVKDSITV